MRIVSLLPSATEILFGIGAGGDVVGVTHECDYPHQAIALPKLTRSALPQTSSPGEIDRHVRASLHQGSSLYHLDSELLERLAPDLIVTQELCRVCAVSYEIVDRAARRLSTDPRIISLEPASLDDVYANISTLGNMTGHGPEAENFVHALRQRENAVRERAAARVKPAVLLLEWTDPPMNGGHWTPGLLETAGARATLGSPGANSRVLSWGEIAAADPDAIVVAPCGFGMEATIRAIEALDGQTGWNALRAVRQRRVFPVDGNAYVNRPGPRLVDTLEIFEQIVSQVRDVV